MENNPILHASIGIIYQSPSAPITKKSPILFCLRNINVLQFLIKSTKTIHTQLCISINATVSTNVGRVWQHTRCSSYLPNGL